MAFSLLLVATAAAQVPGLAQEQPPSLRQPPSSLPRLRAPGLEDGVEGVEGVETERVTPNRPSDALPSELIRQMREEIRRQLRERQEPERAPAEAGEGPGDPDQPPSPADDQQPTQPPLPQRPPDVAPGAPPTVPPDQAPPAQSTQPAPEPPVEPPAEAPGEQASEPTVEQTAEQPPNQPSPPPGEQPTLPLQPVQLDQEPERHWLLPALLVTLALLCLHGCRRWLKTTRRPEASEAGLVFTCHPDLGSQSIRAEPSRPSSALDTAGVGATLVIEAFCDPGEQMLSLRSASSTPTPDASAAPPAP